MYSFKDLGRYVGLQCNCFYKNMPLIIFHSFMLLQSKVRGNMTAALMLEESVAIFPEPKKNG